MNEVGEIKKRWQKGKIFEEFDEGQMVAQAGIDVNYLLEERKATASLIKRMRDVLKRISDVSVIDEADAWLKENDHEQ